MGLLYDLDLDSSTESNSENVSSFVQDAQDSKQSDKLYRVEVRRKVEEIMSDKAYRQRYSDPYGDFNDD